MKTYMNGKRTYNVMSVKDFATFSANVCCLKGKN